MTRIVALTVLGAMLFLLPGSPDADASDRAKLRAMMNRLESTLVNVNFDDTALDDAVRLLQRFTGINLIVSPKLRNEDGFDEITISLRLTKVSAKQALRIMMEFHDLGLVYRGGVLQVTTKEDSRGKPVLRIYSIADLTFPIRDFPGPDLQLRPSGSEFEMEEIPVREDPFEDPQFIVDLIQANVEPETWEAENVGVTSTRKVLLIRQSPAVHAKIARLLMLLRAAK